MQYVCFENKKMQEIVHIMQNINIYLQQALIHHINRVGGKH